MNTMNKLRHQKLIPVLKSKKFLAVILKLQIFFEKNLLGGVTKPSFYTS